MKPTLVILTILVPLISAVSLPEHFSLEDYDSDYVKTVNELHRGPPVQHSYQRSNVETRWISQKLDNFDEDNEKVWNDVREYNRCFFNKEQVTKYH